MERKNRRPAALRPKNVALAVSAAFLPWAHAASADPAANQLPTGSSVAAGTVSISTGGSKMQIDQASDKAILNWQNFSIGKDGWVTFNQPSASSVALNRSQQPAEIFGRLSANGQVFITSQAGVYFARTAQVDVGGLVATNLSILDQDFLAGRYLFSNRGSTGSVVNEGTIITPGGYAALAGTQVRNDGVIIAQAGTVALAAGDRMTLDMVGDGLIKVSVDAAALNALALNAGTIQADGGRVILTARSANALLDTVINNTGVIRARSLVERNGEIVLDGGSAGVVANSGSVDASGTDTTGGKVQVSGQHVYLAEGSSIDASGNAGGGTVTVKGSDTAYVYGSIDASGTGEGASGGYVETSGHYLEVGQAPNVGAGGTWLIDPYNIDVVAGSGTGNNGGAPSFTPNGDNSQIGADLIVGQLNSGTNVILDTGGAGSPGAQAGDVRVLAAIDKTVANPASLTLKAFHDVQISQPITIASAFGPTGYGTLKVEAGNDVVVSAPINLPGGGLNVRAGGFTNLSAINNGVGGDLKPGMAIFADRFDLAGGTINGGMGSVGLFTRTNTNTLGVESAGDTRITNADIASITTSPDSPLTNANQLLIGVGSGGAMRIGDDAQVNGGSKNLVFSGGFGPGTRITVGANGVTTTGDVMLDGSGGSIAGSGVVGGNRVVLRASTGIGQSTARVATAANTLAVNTGGNAFVTEVDDVTLDNISTMGSSFSNFASGAYDFAANGSVTVNGNVFAAGSMKVDVAQDLNVVASPGRTAILNTNGNQTISAANISLQAALSGDNGRALITNAGGTGDQVITVSGGALTLTAGAGGLGNQAVINSNGNQTINGNPQITLTGGASGTGSVATNTHNSAVILTNGPGKTQSIYASAITAKAGAGNDAFAGMIGANQSIVVSGDVRLTGGAGTGAPIARIGGVSGAAPGATNLFLSARDVILTGGDSATGDAMLGSTPAGTSPQPNAITVIAARDVILDARTGSARIGTSQNFATPATGDISVAAGRNIQLNGGANTAAIRTAGNVNLSAGGSITENQASAAITAAHLNTSASGNTSLIGDNQLGSYSGATTNPGASLTLVDAGALQLTGVATNNGAITVTTDSLGNAGAVTNGGAASTANVVFNANAFNLAGGTIDGGAAAVILRPRTGSNSFGIEAVGATTLTNADIATINTSNFIVFGSGLGTTFTGSMTIGENAVVNGGGRNLAFFRSSSLGGTTTIGSRGVATTGDVIVSAGGGAIVSNGGTVAGDEVQLRASQGIGQGTPVHTAANALAVNNGGGPGAFVTEADNVVLRTVFFTVGGLSNVVSNFSGTTYDLASGGDVTVSDTVQSNGAMKVNVAGNLDVIASPGRSAMLSSNGNQTISAANISLQAALSGDNGKAFITNTVGTGDQTITVSGGSLTLAGGAGGLANQAGILSNGNQTINGNPQITLTGGASGTGSVATQTHNNAVILANGSGKTQTINAASITAKAGGGNDAFAGIIGANQTIIVSGDVQLTGGAGTGAPIARIGGVSGSTPGATNLFLSARDVILTGGDSATGDAMLGSTSIGTSPQPNAVTVIATRDVILDARNGGARIGTSENFALPASGDISINAGRNIELNGGANSAGIRTAGNVSLDAGGSITENQFNATVTATALTTTSGGSTSLVGNNQVSSYNGSSGGDLSLANTGTLTVTGLTAGGNATLTNTGDVTLSGPWNSFTASVATLGDGSDLTINNNVTSSGAMNLDVAGNLSVSAGGLQDARVHSFGGQTISARAVQVSARDGRSASLWNTGPTTQSITASNGAGVDVVVPSGGGFAQILADAGSNQSITVVDGDHINVNGATGSASIIAFNTAQTLSITGRGANAITMGSTGALGSSFAHASKYQSVTAGNPGEAGSITIVGPGINNALAGLYDNPNLGGTQTISTPGVISITGGTAPSQLSNFFTGIAHNGSGQQTITAGGIALKGGPSGNGNGATIGAFGGGVAANAGSQVIDVGSGNISVTGGTGGNANTAIINALRDQTIHVGGTLSVSGGAVGVGNRAGIVAGSNQTIDGGADIVLTGGASGGVALNGNNAFINMNGGVGTQQTIHAASLNLLSGAGGTDNSAAMGAIKQLITVDDDVNLIGGGSAGTLGGVRLGGLGGAAATATDLTLILNNGGNLTLTGGSLPSNVVAISSTAVAPTPLANNISISTSGNVVLNPGASSARIGNSATAADAGGDISISAAAIQLNGAGATPTYIRTAGNVSLTAGPGGISEGTNGFVVASELTTSSGGSTSLAGPNQVARFTAEAASGDVSLRNTAPVLTLGTMDLTGSLSIDQAGALAVPGTVSAANQSLHATGDVTIGSASGAATAGLFAPGTIGIGTPQSIVLRGSDVSSGASSVVSAGGLVRISAGDLLLTGGAADLAASSVLGGELVVTTARNIELTSGSGWNANALLYSGSNITLTVGGMLILNGGHSVDNWTRVQTQDYDGTITLNFPNAAAGSVLVDGFAEKFKHGEDGFFTADKPAKLGDTLFVNYGM